MWGGQADSCFQGPEIGVAALIVPLIFDNLSNFWP